MKLFSILNEAVILRGLPLMRHIPGFRPWTRAYEIHFPKDDQARLAALAVPGKSVHFNPVHPVTFGDWMFDKFITDRVAPECAHWASGDMVNGLNRFVQRMCLQNNIIAQGTSDPENARAFSVAHAAQGKGVLLHPEGRVGWHNNYVGELIPSSVEMAMETYGHDLVENAYVAPILWKIIFRKDVTPKLMQEYRYAAIKLGHVAAVAGLPPEGIFAIYANLIAQHEENWFPTSPRNGTLRQRRDDLLAVLLDYVDGALDIPIDSGGWRIMNRLKKWLKEHKEHPEQARGKKAAAALNVVLELGPHAFENPHMTQEEAAEHLKRIRSSYCKGSWRDVQNRLAPRLAGPCEVFIKVPEALRVPKKGDAELLAQNLRTEMQRELDVLVEEAHREYPVISWQNPFHTM